ncbi:neural proliferation differentiation and control protein 1a isoform X2 [Lepisosteus oculatus]|uniref:neural proliferation differentiation and control protein 1a isoform X2 n=1 Tax=Lepisosteus oculatus TaxID=7918 RepID=UPI0037133362
MTAPRPVCRSPAVRTRMLTETRGAAGRASLPLGVCLCAILLAVGASLPGSACPRSLDCALQRRELCPPGSPHCGPCIAPLVEDEHRNCVARRKQTRPALSSLPATSTWRLLLPKMLCAMAARRLAPPNQSHKRRLRVHSGKETPLPELDEEIDYLSSIIAKQQQAELGKPGPSPQPGPKQSNPAQEHGPPHSATGRPRASPSPPSAAPTQAAGRGGPVTSPYPSSDSLLIVMIAVCIVVGTAALIVAGVCWIRLQKDVRLAQKVDYPAFGVMGPSSFDSTSPGDKKLAQSAQMYHYQHQKQQMLSLEKHKDEPKIPDSGTTTDEENEDGDFTVYECPGLAPTGEMEVKNPLFDDSSLHPQRNHK